MSCPLFSYALKRVGEGRDCLADYLSNNGVNNDNGSFFARAGDAAEEGRLLLLTGWLINSIVCSRWAERTMRDHACRQAVEPIVAKLAAAAHGTKTTRWRLRRW